MGQKWLPPRPQSAVEDVWAQHSVRTTRQGSHTGREAAGSQSLHHTSSNTTDRPPGRGSRQLRKHGGGGVGNGTGGSLSYRRFTEDTGRTVSLTDVDVACRVHLRDFDLGAGNDDVTGAWQGG